MRLGLYLNLYGTPDERPRLEDAVEQARLAEQAGFEWIVLGERHLHRPGYHEILTSLTYLAAKTDRIGLATSGIVAPLYDPVVLAETLAHIDVLSGGRLTAGFRARLPAGGVRAVRRDAGRAGRAVRGVPDHPHPVVDRGRGHVRRQVHQHPRGVPVAATGAESASATVERRPRLRRTGTDRPDVRRVDDVVQRTRLRPAGEDRRVPRVPEWRGHVGSRCDPVPGGLRAPTSQDARQALEEPLRDLYDAYAGWKRTSADASRYTQGWDDIAARSVIGSPAECADRLAHYEEMGADGIILRIQPPGLLPGRRPPLDRSLRKPRLTPPRRSRSGRPDYPPWRLCRTSQT